MTMTKTQIQRLVDAIDRSPSMDLDAAKEAAYFVRKIAEPGTSGAFKLSGLSGALSKMPAAAADRILDLVEALMPEAKPAAFPTPEE